MDKSNITAIIVVKNKPPHLFETLDSIDGLVSEIIIGNIDIGKDYEEKLVRNKKIKIIGLPSNTPFADVVKDDLKKKTKSEYILYLDPDEIFPTISNQQLIILLTQYDYFYFPRKNIIFGKWIQHSRWWPDYQLRLFRKEAVIWPRELHPKPKGKGREYKFEAREEYALLHYNYDNIDQYLEKATRYAKSEAESLSKRKENYTLTITIQKALSEFMSRFFANGGYKDGMHGFVLAILQMFYYFLVFFYFWEGKKYFNVDQKEITSNSHYFFRQGFKEINFWLIKQKITRGIAALKLKLINKFL